MSECTAKINIQNLDAVNNFTAYVIDEIKNLNQQLEYEKENGERFNELYMCSLKYILMAISQQSVSVLDEAVKKLADIEKKYITE